MILPEQVLSSRIYGFEEAAPSWVQHDFCGTRAQLTFGTRGIDCDAFMCDDTCAHHWLHTL